MDEVVHERERSYIIRGQFADHVVIGKLSRDRSLPYLQAELLTYVMLSRLQGLAVPRCFGLFDVETLGHILLLEYCGQPIRTFDELSETQK